LNIYFLRCTILKIVRTFFAAEGSEGKTLD